MIKAFSQHTEHKLLTNQLNKFYIDIGEKVCKHKKYTSNIHNNSK